MILGNLPNSIRRPNMTKKEILDTMTHLHLQQKKLSNINVLAGKTAYSEEGKTLPILLALTPGLQNIYLQQNYLTSVGNGFMGLRHLVTINLFGNYIAKMDCFSECPKLRKLYLEHNRISRLEGLQNCACLEELYIGHQKYVSASEFTFDEYSLAAISRSLVLFDLPDVKLISCKPLYFLENLITLNLADNMISDFDSEVSPVLMTLHRLRTLNLKSNPVTKINKYRD
jgi:Leucine-rich repeat (LRR) protein